MITFAVSDSIEGKDIKRIRNKLRLTQAEFAGLVNVSKKTIERWEQGGGKDHGTHSHSGTDIERIFSDRR